MLLGVLGAVADQASSFALGLCVHLSRSPKPGPKHTPLWQETVLGRRAALRPSWTSELAGQTPGSGWFAGCEGSAPVPAIPRYRAEAHRPSFVSISLENLPGFCEQNFGGLRRPALCRALKPTHTSHSAPPPPPHRLRLLEQLFSLGCGLG